jgi:glycerol 2-dehydrogenase (NADP+)
MQRTGSDIRFPKKPDGSRDLDFSWSHMQTWKQMEALLKTGKTRAIGVCNYSVKYLNELLREATVTPAVNQIENHPCLPQNEIVEFCKEKGIHVTAYSPLGSTGSPLANDPSVQSLAAKYEVPQSTVLLSYHRKLKLTLVLTMVTLTARRRSWKFCPGKIRYPQSNRSEQTGY